MRTWLRLFFVCLACSVWFGCGGGPSEVAVPTNNNGDRPSFPTGQGQAQSESGGEGASTPSRGNTVASRNSRRNLPAAAVGGGGGAIQSVTPPGRGSATSPPSNNMASTGPFTAETKANGLFPQMPGSGNATAGFGGALFPVASGGSSAAGGQRGSSGGGSLWSRITGFGSGGSRESKPPANAKPTQRQSNAKPRATSNACQRKANAKGMTKEPMQSQRLTCGLRQREFLLAHVVYSDWLVRDSVRSHTHTHLSL